MVVVLILLLTVYSLRRLWVVWAEILNFDGVSGDTRDTCPLTRGLWHVAGDTWWLISFGGNGNSIFTESD